MTKHRQNPQRRRRITPAEADQLTAHMSPAQRAQAIEAYMAHLRSIGVDVELLYDAAGRSFFKIDIDQLRARSPLLAAIYEQIAEIAPEPVGHQPKTA